MTTEEIEEHEDSSSDSKSADSVLPATTGRSVGVHRFALLAICLVWPLIWVGGLVTTYDAGMAVPDWPNTYGRNLWLYPWKTWLFGPFDLFIEHGHRLLGTVVGLVGILILVASIMKEKRSWVTWLAALFLAMVIGQGILGGVRVLREDRTIAMLHGCVGPICFALCVFVAVVTGKSWYAKQTLGASELPNISKAVSIIGVIVLATSYLQSVFGAQLRHVQPNTSPSHFTLIVFFHVVTAFLLWAMTCLLWAKTRRCGDLTLSRPALVLIGLVGVQIALGIGTWVVNYGWPVFLQFVPGSTGFLVRAKGYWDSLIVTAHVATGSLILSLAVVALLRILQVRYLANLLKVNQTVTTK